MFTYQPLAPDQIAPYAAMTFERYRAYLYQAHTEHVRFLRWGASLDGQPVGLLLAQANRHTHKSGVLSLYTLPGFRRQGVARGLLRACEADLTEHGAPSIEALYSTATRSLPIVEHLLARAGWHGPERLNTIVYIPTTRAVYAQFLQNPMGCLGCDLPPGYAYASWLALDDTTRAKLRAEIAETVPPDENPFSYDDTPIDPSSTVIWQGDAVVAWMITHRLTPDRLRFSLLHLHGAHRGQKLGLKLINETVRRAIAVFDDEHHQEMFLFQTRANNDLMQAYAHSIGNVVSHTEELRRMHKAFPSI